jgi:cation diffusion facilitator CzcD-associated flavoprotein CzcO
MSKRIAIIGAGPAGLMAAEVLSQYAIKLMCLNKTFCSA